jgi:hypothetical protein
MRILVANDDGIYSPGILALARAAARYGDVRIMAPDVEQSSMGHAITHSRPLSVKRTPIDGFDAYRVNGTPADCVALGLELWEGVEVVLSGINLGYNLGNSMWHSGTLAAAKQAAGAASDLPGLVELFAGQAAGLAHRAANAIEERLAGEAAEVMLGETLLRAVGERRHAGGMFWLSRNTLAGSYFSLMAASRVQVAPGYAVRTPCSSASVRREAGIRSVLDSVVMTPAPGSSRTSRW